MNKFILLTVEGLMANSADPDQLQHVRESTFKGESMCKGENTCKGESMCKGESICKEERHR